MNNSPIRLIYVLSTVFLVACGASSPEQNKAGTDSVKVDTSTNAGTNSKEENGIAGDSSDFNNAIYYVLVADTGTDYSSLRQKMIDLKTKSKIPIDTMGHTYNKKKNLIALPDDDKDEVYAGQYIPRRFPSENLSLEYLNFYQKQAGEKTIALVTGIYETEKSADSVLTSLRKIEPKVFKIKADIYVGCMH
jgi:hypothetical protein